MGSRPHFRARPISYTKPLPIIRSEDDPYYEEDTTHRDAPQVPTGMEDHETKEVHLQKALRNSVFGNRKPETIPLPIFHKVERHKDRRFTPWQRPQQYIIFDRTDEDLMEHAVDYSLDAVDDKWYESLPERKRGTLTPATLELAMDTLERLQGREEALISWNKAKPGLEPLGIPNDTTKLAIYNHWLSRRKEEKGPFHRLFKPPVDPQDKSSHIAFRPRSDTTSLARRQNTFENYKRLASLAPQFQALRELLALIAKREELKASQAAVKMFMTRVECAKHSQRTASAFKALCTSAFEVALVTEPLEELPGLTSAATSPTNASFTVKSHSLHIPLRGLELPAEVESGLKKLTPPKRKRNKSTAKAARGQDGDGTPTSHAKSKASQEEPGGFGAATGTPTDQYGYDEMAAKFMRHMRYFAGGFSNFGVNPYDHRVFSAASERNTVRYAPSEPPSVLYPYDVSFAKKNDTPFLTGGGKVGARGRTQDNARKPIRVRLRVGRLGRIALDRVVYEAERGVKAASYPASVERGGVYTGGIPLEYYDTVFEEQDDEDLWSPSEQKLIAPLAPILPVKRARSRNIRPYNDDEDIPWPSLQKLKTARKSIQKKPKEKTETEAPILQRSGKGTDHPRYKVSNPLLVEEV